MNKNIMELVENIIIMFKLTYGKDIHYSEDRYSHLIIYKNDVVLDVAKKSIGLTYRVSDKIAVFHLEYERILDYGYQSLENNFRVGERWIRIQRNC